MGKTTTTAAVGAALAQSGKKVVAYADSYAQGPYYLAAQADEVYLHPQGMVLLEGYGRWRNYYKEGLDRFGVELSPDREGAWSFRVEGWSDVYGTWDHDATIKIEAGVVVCAVCTVGALAFALVQGSRRRLALAVGIALVAFGLRSIATQMVYGTAAPLAWFVAPAIGNLHLLSATVPPVDAGAALSPGWADSDIDAQAREALRDVGADEAVAPLFADGFEAGDAQAWSAVVP